MGGEREILEGAELSDIPATHGDPPYPAHPCRTLMQDLINYNYFYQGTPEDPRGGGGSRASCCSHATILTSKLLWAKQIQSRQTAVAQDTK